MILKVPLVVKVPIGDWVIVNVSVDVLVAKLAVSAIEAVIWYVPALKLAVGLITYVLPTLVADNAAPAKEEVNELKSIVSPSVSLNVKVTKVFPGLAPLVF